MRVVELPVRDWSHARLGHREGQTEFGTQAEVHGEIDVPKGDSERDTF